MPITPTRHSTQAKITGFFSPTSIAPSPSYFYSRTNPVEPHTAAAPNNAQTPGDAAGTAAAATQLISQQQTQHGVFLQPASVIRCHSFASESLSSNRSCSPSSSTPKAAAADSFHTGKSLASESTPAAPSPVSVRPSPVNVRPGTAVVNEEDALINQDLVELFNSVGMNQPKQITFNEADSLTDTLGLRRGFDWSKSDIVRSRCKRVVEAAKLHNTTPPITSRKRSCKVPGCKAEIIFQNVTLSGPVNYTTITEELQGACKLKSMKFHDVHAHVLFDHANAAAAAAAALKANGSVSPLKDQADAQSQSSKSTTPAHIETVAKKLERLGTLNAATVDDKKWARKLFENPSKMARDVGIGFEQYLDLCIKIRKNKNIGVYLDDFVDERIKDLESGQYSDEYSLGVIKEDHLGLGFNVFPESMMRKTLLKENKKAGTSSPVIRLTHITFVLKTVHVRIQNHIKDFTTLYGYVTKNLSAVGITARMCKIFLITCEHCQTHKKLNRTSRIRRPKNPISSNQFLERVVMDLTTFTIHEGKYAGDYIIFNAIDHFSRYIYSEHIQDKSKISVVLALSNFVKSLGCMKILHSDNGGEFVNDMVEDFCKRINAQFIQGSPFYPEGQGMVESANKSLKIDLFNFITSKENEAFCEKFILPKEFRIPLATTCKYDLNPAIAVVLQSFNSKFRRSTRIPSYHVVYGQHNHLYANDKKYIKLSAESLARMKEEEKAQEDKSKSINGPGDVEDNISVSDSEAEPNIKLEPAAPLVNEETEFIPATPPPPTNAKFPIQHRPESADTVLQPDPAPNEIENVITWEQPHMDFSKIAASEEYIRWDSSKLWATDNIIDRAISRLNDHQSDIWFFSVFVFNYTLGYDPRKNPSWKTSTIVWEEEYTMKKFSRYLKGKFVKWLQNGGNRLFFPINHGNMHWLACLVDFNLRTVTFYDSSPNISERHADDGLGISMVEKRYNLFLNIVFALWKLKVHSGPFVHFSEWKTSWRRVDDWKSGRALQKMPHQPDGNSCGYMVILLAKSLCGLWPKQWCLSEGTINFTNVLQSNLSNNEDDLCGILLAWLLKLKVELFINERNAPPPSYKKLESDDEDEMNTRLDGFLSDVEIPEFNISTAEWQERQSAITDIRESARHNAQHEGQLWHKHDVTRVQKMIQPVLPSQHDGVILYFTLVPEMEKVKSKLKIKRIKKHNFKESINGVIIGRNFNTHPDQPYSCTIATSDGIVYNIPCNSNYIQIFNSHFDQQINELRTKIAAFKTPAEMNKALGETTLDDLFRKINAVPIQILQGTRTPKSNKRRRQTEEGSESEYMEQDENTRSKRASSKKKQKTRSPIKTHDKRPKTLQFFD